MDANSLNLQSDDVNTVLLRGDDEGPYVAGASFFSWPHYRHIGMRSRPLRPAMSITLRTSAATATVLTVDRWRRRGAASAIVPY